MSIIQELKNLNEVKNLRSASSVEGFPYLSESVTYIFCDKETGEIVYLIPKKRKISNSGLGRTLLLMCKAVTEGTGSLCAVWAGRWQSDAFIIDDVTELQKLASDLVY